jgi:hypothetical protein
MDQKSGVATDDSASFYLTYLIGELPSNYILQRFNLGLTLSIYILGWGKSDTLTARMNIYNSQESASSALVRFRTGLS